MVNNGASVVISHHILDGKQEEYEEWLKKIGPLSQMAKGHIDWQIIRPISNLTYNYTVIIRFDSIENLKRWMESQQRKDLINEVSPLFTKDDKYYIKSGLDFLFTPDSGSTNPPLRWKQFLVTWSAIYPLSIIIPILLLPILRLIGLPQNRFLDALFVSCVIVFIMVYFLMPNYTRLIKSWLYK